MTEGIIVALITGAFTFAGVVLTVYFGNKKTAMKIKEQADLTRYRIDQLEKKQDKHNSLIERMFKLEQRVDDLEHNMK